MTGGLSRRLQQVRKLFRLLRVPGWRRALRHGTAAAVEHAGMLGSVTPGSLIDIGAHRGQFTAAALAIHPRLRVHAFEPQADPAGRFAALFGGDPRVTLHRCAIGPRDAAMAMHISNRSDSSSLLPIGAEQVRAFPGTHPVGSETVPVRRLDSVLAGTPLPAPVLMKIDVQGFELQVLDGCGDRLGSIDLIYAELSFRRFYDGQPLAADVIAWLAARGFTLAAVHNLSTGPQGEALQADMLFSRPPPG